MSQPDTEWEPTTDEVIEMWEDMVMVCAFQMVHGVEAGYRRFRYLRFGVPESAPLPAGVDLRVQLPIFTRAEP